MNTIRGGTTNHEDLRATCARTRNLIGYQFRDILSHFHTSKFVDNDSGVYPPSERTQYSWPPHDQVRTERRRFITTRHFRACLPWLYRYSILSLSFSRGRYLTNTSCHHHFIIYLSQATWPIHRQSHTRTQYTIIQKKENKKKLK